VLGDMSGIFTAMSGKGSIVAAQMAIDEMGGKVLGREVRILTGDSQNKPDVGAAIVKRWFEAEGVSMVTDNWVRRSASPYRRRRGAPIRLRCSAARVTADLTGKECSATGFVWTFDTDTLSRAIATTLVKQGLDTWYFLTPDFIFGHQAEASSTEIVKSLGGKVMGSSRFPLTNIEFSSFLLTAQASKAKVIVMTAVTSRPP
jgi:branched-chain amino acid transport system substrate-binding protein